MTGGALKGSQHVVHPNPLHDSAASPISDH